MVLALAKQLYGKSWQSMTLEVRAQPGRRALSRARASPRSARHRPSRARS